MNRSTVEQIAVAIQASGHLSAGEISARTRSSQPTVSRAIATLGPSILRIGRGRNTRYALRRQIGQLGSEWPLYEIGPSGDPVMLGTLTAISGGGCFLDLCVSHAVIAHGEHRNGLFPGLPWFIYDMRPRGFMGRAFARSQMARLGLPHNPERWTDDELMLALLAAGVDLPGAYIIGHENIDTYLAHRGTAIDAIPAQECATVYPALASAALSGEVVGSSAGGEQPKFTAGIRRSDGQEEHVLVKFSGELSNPVGRRWGDLLLAEHLAAQTLADAGVPAARSTVVEAGGRIFLELVRFDRCGTDGRRPVVTLEALDAGLLGSGAAIWGEAIPSLLRQSFITVTDARRLEESYHFGLLIGNDDMHLGNLSFHIDLALPLRPAPLYDMLPMHYSPRTNGDLPSGPVRPRAARPEEQDARQRAEPLARAFWRQVADDIRVSAQFRSIAAANAAQ